MTAPTLDQCANRNSVANSHVMDCAATQCENSVHSPSSRHFVNVPSLLKRAFFQSRFANSALLLPIGAAIISTIILNIFILPTISVTAHSTFTPRAASVETSLRGTEAHNSLQEIVQIVGGDAHTCALDTAGVVFCWGNNGYGQLGDGTTENRPVPGLVFNLPGPAQALTAGGNHTCAWVQTEPNPAESQVRSQLQAPFDNITTDGTNAVESRANELDGSAIYCWGSNSNGQLGNGTSDSSEIPVEVSDSESLDVMHVTAGEAHTCALAGDGRVACWGNNEVGQLGNGTMEDSLEPIFVSGVDVSGAAEENLIVDGQLPLVSAGGSHTCAVTSEGPVCWGKNSFGQLGDGTTENRLVPTAVVAGTSDVRSLAIGRLHSCAVSKGGNAFCWGSNFYGQLGNGTDGIQNDSSVPTAVNEINESIVEIFSHGFHTCAISDNQNTYCWGFNLYGQLGDGSQVNQNQPTLIQLNGRDLMQTVSAGHNHTCGISTNQLYCWGNNFSGQLGNGNNEDQSSPAIVADVPERTFLSYISSPKIVAPPPTPVPQPFWQRVGQDGLTVRTIEAVDKGTEKTLHVGLLLNEAAIGLYQANIGAGCVLPAGLTPTALSRSVLDLDIVGNNGVLANYDLKPHYSTDQGQSWNPTNSDIEIHPYSVTYEPSSGWWFAGADEGLFRSTDNGVTWAAVSESPLNINVVKTINGEIWLGTADEGLSVYNPTNSGFTPLTRNLTGESKTIWDILPADLSDGSRIYILATAAGVYQGTGVTGWTAIGGPELDQTAIRTLAVVPSTPTLLYVGTISKGVWQIELGTGNVGQAVTSVGWSNTQTVRHLYYEEQYCQSLFAGTDDGLWILFNP